MGRNRTKLASSCLGQVAETVIRKLTDNHGRYGHETPTGAALEQFAFKLGGILGGFDSLLGSLAAGGDSRYPTDFMSVISSFYFPHRIASPVCILIPVAHFMAGSKIRKRVQTRLLL